MTVTLERVFTSRFARRVLRILVVLTLIYFGLLLWWNHTLKGQMGLVEYKKMKRFFRESVIVPEEMKQPPSYSPELIESARSVNSNLQPLVDFMRSEEIVGYVKQIEEGESLTEEQYRFLAEELAAWEPSLDGIEALLLSPEYDMTATYLPFGYEILNFPQLRTIVQLLLTQMRLDIHEGRHEEAFHKVELALCLIRHSTYVPNSETIFADTEIPKTAEACHGLISEVGDSELLRKWLDRLLETRDLAIPSLPEDVIVSDCVLGLRMSRQRDPAIRIPDEGPKADYLREYVRAKLRSRPPSRLPDQHLYVSRFPGLLRIQSVAEFYYMHLARSAEQVRAGRQCEEAYYDLLCMEIAQRILELEAQAEDHSGRPGLSSFFEEVPLDPYTARPFLWDASKEMFYSMGLDLTDDHARTKYEPDTSKRMRANGDIFLGFNKEQ